MIMDRNQDDQIKCKEDLKKLKLLYEEQIKQLDYDIENNRLKLFGTVPVTYGLLL